MFTRSCDSLGHRPACSLVRESSIINTQTGLSAGRAAHWCSGLGTLLLNERARVHFLCSIFGVKGHCRFRMQGKSETGTGAVAIV